MPDSFWMLKYKGIPGVALVQRPSGEYRILTLALAKGLEEKGRAKVLLSAPSVESLYYRRTELPAEAREWLERRIGKFFGSIIRVPQAIVKAMFDCMEESRKDSRERFFAVIKLDKAFLRTPVKVGTRDSIEFAVEHCNARWFMDFHTHLKRPVPSQTDSLIHFFMKNDYMAIGHVPTNSVFIFAMRLKFFECEAHAVTKISSPDDELYLYETVDEWFGMVV